MHKSDALFSLGINGTGGESQHRGKTRVLIIGSFFCALVSAQAHTKFCRPALHLHGAMAINQKVLITSVTQAISTSQMPSLTKVLGESHLSSFVLERWAQRHIQKRYAVAPVCPPEDDLKEQE